MRFATLGALLLLAGCEAATPVSSIVVDTLANGAVRVHNTGGGAWSTGGAWSLSRVVNIGAAADDTLAQFAQIWDFTVDDRGRLYVLDREIEGVRVFTLEGEFVRQIGRSGQGPGELRGASGLAWDTEGQLWIANVFNGRFEVFDSAGDYVTSHPRAALGFGYPWGGRFLESGALSDPSSVRDPDAQASRSVALVQRDPTTPDAVVDTVELPAFERATWRVEQERGRLIAGVPFAPELRWQVDHRGRLWVSVNDEYQIFRTTWAGDTTAVVSRVVERLPVSSWEIDAQLSLFERTMPDFRSRVDLDEIPELKPAYDVFFIDGLDHLWVARTRADETYPGGFENTFDIFDPDGIYLGSLTAAVSTVPPPKVLGDFLVGVSRDEMEIQSLAVYRIEGREGHDD